MTPPTELIPKTNTGSKCGTEDTFPCEENRRGLPGTNPLCGISFPRISMRASNRLLLSSLLMTVACAGTSTGQSLRAVHGDFVIKNFRFTSGEVLPALRLHYRTLGTPERDAKGQVRNAVLIMHGTGGTGAQFESPSFAGELFVPGGLLDAQRYFLIMPDALGFGQSSKPSDGLRAGFPRYGYIDIVTAQYRLLTEGLGVNHLRLVMGTSMGAMHTWLWGERYPDLMDALMPLGSLPTQISGRNRIRSEEHTSELQSLAYLVCRLLLEKKKIFATLPPPLPSISKVFLVAGTPVLIEFENPPAHQSS